MLYYLLKYDPNFLPTLVGHLKNNRLQKCTIVTNQSHEFKGCNTNKRSRNWFGQLELVFVTIVNFDNVVVLVSYYSRWPNKVRTIVCTIEGLTISFNKDCTY